MTKCQKYQIRNKVNQTWITLRLLRILMICLFQLHRLKFDLKLLKNFWKLSLKHNKRRLFLPIKIKLNLKKNFWREKHKRLHLAMYQLQSNISIMLMHSREIQRKNFPIKINRSEIQIMELPNRSNSHLEQWNVIIRLFRDEKKKTRSSLKNHFYNVELVPLVESQEDPVQPLLQLREIHLNLTRLLQMISLVMVNNKIRRSPTKTKTSDKFSNRQWQKNQNHQPDMNQIMSLKNIKT